MMTRDSLRRDENWCFLAVSESNGTEQNGGTRVHGQKKLTKDFIEALLSTELQAGLYNPCLGMQREAR